MARTAKWLQDWHQREISDNDEMIGLSWPSFIDLVRDIHAFQYAPLFIMIMKEGS
jgi:hypothetical protein